jgi:hypothetical protein
MNLMNLDSTTSAHVACQPVFPSSAAPANQPFGLGFRHSLGTFPADDYLQTMTFTFPPVLFGEQDLKILCISESPEVRASNIQMTALKVDNLTRQP